MNQKKYPALYVTSTKGTMYKHCSVNPTIYFEMIKDEERAQKDEDYNDYMEAMKDECYDALIHKFITSQPLKVTNDKIPFIIFKSNIDLRSVRYFCKAILDEVFASTGSDPKAKYLEIPTIFLEINKDPSFLKVNKIGDKLTRSSLFNEKMEVLEGSHKAIDSGIITPFQEYNTLHKEKQQEQEEIVEW